MRMFINLYLFVMQGRRNDFNGRPMFAVSTLGENVQWVQCILYSLVYYDPYWMVVPTVGLLLNVHGIYTNEGTECA